ncbi:MAG: biotin/lipoyl-containing protein, partial [Halobacteriota archaeon]
MTRDFRLPDVGEGIREAEVINWMVEEGDAVREDDPVLEVETDKAIIEIPSPVNGRVLETMYTEGEVVEVGDVIVRFESDEEVEKETDGSTEEREPERHVNNERTEGLGVADERVFAAPSTRRLARDVGVDITEVEGTGRGGRVTDSDVLEAAGVQRTEGEADEVPPEEDDGVVLTRSGERQTEERTPGASESDVRSKSEIDRKAREKRADAGRAGDSRPDETVAESHAGSEEGERRPYSGVRRRTGERLVRAADRPLVTHHDDVDVTRLREVLDETDGLGFTPFVVKACAAALDDHPALNSWLDEDAGEVVERGRVD